MSILEELASSTHTRAEELKKQREKGTKVIAYTGRFVPEELIYAAGAVPYLLCRGGEPEPPEAVLPYMLRFLSPFRRTQIGGYLLGLDPVIPMVDLTIVQCSDCHESRLADLFEYLKLPTARIGVPPDWDKSISMEYYYKGLIRLKEKLESLTGNSISDERLKESIKPINRVRDLLNKISLLRREQPPPIGGYDFIRLNHFSFYCDLGELTSKLDALYQQLQKDQSPFSKEVPRILLAGHVVAVGDYVVPKLIESSGGAIVAEFLDEGIRQYEYSVDNEGNLISNLTKTYYSERTPPSVFQPAWDARVFYMKEMIKDFNIDAVIWYQISFEEIYDMECSIFAKAMEEMNIPFLKLESSYEYSREAMGPLTTRIESFVQLINQKRS